MVWAVALLVGGLMVLFSSFVPWGTCPDTTCGAGGTGLFVLVERSGIDFGPGVLTAICGLVLATCGAALLGGAHLQLIRVAPLLIAPLVLGIIAAFWLRMYVFPDYLLYGPDIGVFGVAAGGAISGVAGLGLRGHASAGQADRA